MGAELLDVSVVHLHDGTAAWELLPFSFKATLFFEMLWLGLQNDSSVLSAAFRLCSVGRGCWRETGRLEEEELILSSLLPVQLLLPVPVSWFSSSG